MDHRHSTISRQDAFIVRVLFGVASSDTEDS